MVRAPRGPACLAQALRDTIAIPHAVEVDGQMVDYPIVDRAQALLEAMREIRAQGG